MRQRKIVLIAAFLITVFCFPLIASAEDECPKSQDGKHDWKWTDQCETIDGTYHNEIYECSACRAKKYEKDDHSWMETGGYKAVDSTYHRKEYQCYECWTKKYGAKEVHHSNNYPEYTYINDTYHGRYDYCADCSRFFCYDKTTHDWEYTNTYRNCGNAYHYVIVNCSSCGCESYKKQAHEWDTLAYVVKSLATLKRNGKIAYPCVYCSAKRIRSIPWKYDTEYSQSYDMSHSIVYRDSKFITIKFHKPVKGAILKVKIGKKTYKKKIRSKKKKVKVRIKRPKYAKTIKIRLYYKGKLIGTDVCRHGEDWVLYAKKIKKGMTKRQVKYVYRWGTPDSKGGSSGGWSYWYYDDGSYVVFKNGRVADWYKSH